MLVYQPFALIFYPAYIFVSFDLVHIYVALMDETTYCSNSRYAMFYLDVFLFLNFACRGNRKNVEILVLPRYVCTDGA